MYKRNFRKERLENAAATIGEFADQIETVFYDVILDNPWETDEDISETLMMLSGFPTPYQLSLFSLTFYPETDIYTLAKKDGFINEDLEDVYRKYYLGTQKTYMNSLFYLLGAYAKRGGKFRITPRIMSWLTSRKLRKLGVSWLLYNFLKFGFMILWMLPSNTQGPLYLFRKAREDISRGDWSRINLRYLVARSPLFGHSNTTLRTHRGHRDVPTSVD